MAKAALGRVREAAVTRGRQLVEEALALQERLDALSHGLTERTEENATLTTQVGGFCGWLLLQHLPMSKSLLPLSCLGGAATSMPLCGSIKTTLVTLGKNRRRRTSV